MISKLPIIILSVIMFTCFAILIIGSYRALSEINNKPIKPKKAKFGRVALFNYLAKQFDDPATTKEDKKIIYKAMYRNVADMESDGVYWPDFVKEELTKRKNELDESDELNLFCEYSGLPSVKYYEKISVK